LRLKGKRKRIIKTRRRKDQERKIGEKVFQSTFSMMLNALSISFIEAA
jgi:hypothetical protein